MAEIDLKKYQIRTDLVVDLLDDYQPSDEEKVEKKEIDGILISDVVLGKNNVLNKRDGRYISIFFDDITDTENRKKVINVFIKYLKDMLEGMNLLGKRCLVVGLGNRKSTPDALGPKVVDDILVTKYLFDTVDVQVEEGLSNVSAIIPGVVATTGIETSDIIMGVVNNSKPDFLIVVDALASSSLDRINKTIQLTDTGIAPGSGIGNKRREISYDTMKIPVIAIGVPTVIDGVTIVSDTIRYMMKKFSYNKENIDKHHTKFVPVTNQNYLKQEDSLTLEEKEKLLGLVGSLSDEDMKSLIFEVLTPIGYNLMVTVKEVDFLIDKLSLLISDGINKCLHSNYEK